MNIISAKYGNEENSLESGVLIETEEAGWISTCTKDAPYSGGAWEDLQAWVEAGNVIAPYVSSAA